MTRLILPYEFVYWTLTSSFFPIAENDNNRLPQLKIKPEEWYKND